MRNSIVLMLFLGLVAACGEIGPPDPAQCRQVDVFVADDDVITGTIVDSIEVSDMEEVRRLCRSPFKPLVYGCTYAVGTGEYRIIYMPVSFGEGWWMTPKTHEECHALYEEFDHVYFRH